MGAAARERLAPPPLALPVGSSPAVVGGPRTGHHQRAKSPVSLAPVAIAELELYGGLMVGLDPPDVTTVRACSRCGRGGCSMRCAASLTPVSPGPRAKAKGQPMGLAKSLCAAVRPAARCNRSRGRCPLAANRVPGIGRRAASVDARQGDGRVSRGSVVHKDRCAHRLDPPGLSTMAWGRGSTVLRAPPGPCHPGTGLKGKRSRERAEEGELAHTSGKSRCPFLSEELEIADFWALPRRPVGVGRVRPAASVSSVMGSWRREQRV